jgi:ABC-2 type transport system permease protein
MTRIRALIAKEFADLRRNPAALVPVIVITAIALVLPFAFTVGVPLLLGQPLSDDPSMEQVSAITGPDRALNVEARVQFFLFQQFLLVFLLTPITGAMSLAAHAIIGEKQARTLEPLLATPLSTSELLVAKIVGALAPTLAISFVGLALYFVGIAMLSEPGVLQAMLALRTVALIFLVGPAVALVALQAALVISSRVNDARTAQQFGVLIIIPLTAVVVAQFAGMMWLSARWLAVIGLALLGLWLALTLLSVLLFDRESILTRWK